MTPQEMEETVREVSGIVTALELAVKVLIATHPDKRVACATWHGIKATQVEDCMTNPSFENFTQRTAILDKLAELTRLFESAASHEAKEHHGA